MNSTYDYDPASSKDELLDIVANVLTIIVPVMRPDIAVIIGAFPWCESNSFIVLAWRMRYIVSSAPSPVVVSRNEI